MSISKIFFSLVVWLGMVLSAALMPRGFSFSGVSNRFITPNGDGKNDVAAFTFDNPRFSEVTGKIYDLRGRFIANLTGNPYSSQLTWNGKSNDGQAASTGAYIFSIECEGNVFRGLVVVIR